MVYYYDNCGRISCRSEPKMYPAVAAVAIITKKGFSATNLTIVALLIILKIQKK